MSRKCQIGTSAIHKIGRKGKTTTTTTTTEKEGLEQE